jgi:hypothetical protein
MKPKSEKLDAPAGAAVTISTRAEQNQVEEHVAISANVVSEAIRREGETIFAVPPPLVRGRPSLRVSRGDFDGGFVRDGSASNRALAEPALGAADFTRRLQRRFLIESGKN